MNNFARLFCLNRHLPESAYATAALRASLHLPGRLLYFPIRLFAPNFFAADFDLINGAGWLTRPQDMEFEFEAYRFHPSNQSQLRRRLGFCLSTRKIHRLVWRTLRATAPVPALEPLLPKPEPTARPVDRATTSEAELGRGATGGGDPFADFPQRDYRHVESR